MESTSAAGSSRWSFFSRRRRDSGSSSTLPELTCSKSGLHPALPLASAGSSSSLPASASVELPPSYHSFAFVSESLFETCSSPPGEDGTPEARSPRATSPNANGPPSDGSPGKELKPDNPAEAEKEAQEGHKGKTEGSKQEKKKEREKTEGGKSKRRKDGIDFAASDEKVTDESRREEVKAKEDSSLVKESSYQEVKEAKGRNAEDRSNKEKDATRKEASERTNQEETDGTSKKEEEARDGKGKENCDKKSLKDRGGKASKESGKKERRRSSSRGASPEADGNHDQSAPLQLGADISTRVGKNATQSSSASGISTFSGGRGPDQLRGGMGLACPGGSEKPRRDSPLVSSLLDRVVANGLRRRSLRDEDKGREEDEARAKWFVPQDPVGYGRDAPGKPSEPKIPSWEPEVAKAKRAVQLVKDELLRDKGVPLTPLELRRREAEAMISGGIFPQVYVSKKAWEEAKLDRVHRKDYLVKATQGKPSEQILFTKRGDSFIKPTVLTPDVTASELLDIPWLPVDGSQAREPDPAVQDTVYADTLRGMPEVRGARMENAPLESALLERGAWDAYIERRRRLDEAQDERATQQLTDTLLGDRGYIRTLDSLKRTAREMSRKESIFEGAVAERGTQGAYIPLAVGKHAEEEDVEALERISAMAEKVAGRLKRDEPFADFSWSRQPSFDEYNVNYYFKLDNEEKRREFRVTKDIKASHERVRFAARAVQQLMETPETDSRTKWLVLRDVAKLYGEDDNLPPERPPVQGLRQAVEEGKETQGASGSVERKDLSSQKVSSAALLDSVSPPRKSSTFRAASILGTALLTVAPISTSHASFSLDGGVPDSSGSGQADEFSSRERDVSPFDRQSLRCAAVSHETGDADLGTSTGAPLFKALADGSVKDGKSPGGGVSPSEGGAQSPAKRRSFLAAAPSLDRDGEASFFYGADELNRFKSHDIGIVTVRRDGSMRKRSSLAAAMRVRSSLGNSHLSRQHSPVPAEQPGDIPPDREQSRLPKPSSPAQSASPSRKASSGQLSSVSREEAAVSPGKSRRVCAASLVPQKSGQAAKQGAQSRANSLDCQAGAATPRKGTLARPGSSGHQEKLLTPKSGTPTRSTSPVLERTAQASKKQGLPSLVARRDQERAVSTPKKGRAPLPGPPTPAKKGSILGKGCPQRPASAFRDAGASPSKQEQSPRPDSPSKSLPVKPATADAAVAQPGAALPKDNGSSAASAPPETPGVSEPAPEAARGDKSSISTKDTTSLAGSLQSSQASASASSSEQVSEAIRPTTLPQATGEQRVGPEDKWGANARKMWSAELLRKQSSRSSSLSSSSGKSKKKRSKEVLIPPPPDSPSLPYTYQDRNGWSIDRRRECETKQLEAELRSLKHLKKILAHIREALGPSWEKTLPSSSVLVTLLRHPFPIPLRHHLPLSGEELVERVTLGGFWVDVFHSVWLPLAMERFQIFFTNYKSAGFLGWDEASSVCDWVYYSRTLPRMFRLANYLMAGALESRIAGLHRLLFRLNALSFFSYRVSWSLHFSYYEKKIYSLPNRKQILLEDGETLDPVPMAVLATKLLRKLLNNSTACTAARYNIDAISLLWPYVLEYKDTTVSKEALCLRIFTSPLTNGFFAILARGEVPEMPQSVNLMHSYFLLLTEFLYGGRPAGFFQLLSRSFDTAVPCIWSQVNSALRSASIRNIFLLSDILTFVTDLLYLTCLDGAPLPHRDARHINDRLRSHVLVLLRTSRPDLADPQTWDAVEEHAKCLWNALDRALRGEAIEPDLLEPFTLPMRSAPPEKAQHAYQLPWPSLAKIMPLPNQMPCWRPGCTRDLRLVMEHVKKPVAQQIRYCPKCHIAAYCSQHCQDLHWIQHHHTVCCYFNRPPSFLRFHILPDQVPEAPEFPVFDIFKGMFDIGNAEYTERRFEVVF
ncbi:hypothetical protein BESB_068920 [Besnoitia besnoiti]|uniref:MYND-type domain-containing protein n=1 Tax=Besnoitia besnoiti TaxID=94643 RepID=A0A2A9MAC9_BESBE|nr:hypothetical protein BESB_068920 [Besnoitia besnoiti]PFH34859.1 hypothetical protein BESB_068920 [Besnoitia besnoiti]